MRLSDRMWAVVDRKGRVKWWYDHNNDIIQYEIFMHKESAERAKREWAANDNSNGPYKVKAVKVVGA